MNKIKGLLLAMLIFVSVQPKSHALVGLATGTAPLIIAGLAGGAAPHVIIELQDDRREAKDFFHFLFGLFTIPFTVIMLDDDSGVEFTALSEEMAAGLNLTAEERESFNGELDMVNIIFEEVALKTEEIADPTVEDTQFLWEQYREAVSPATFNALEKIGYQFVQEAAAANE